MDVSNTTDQDTGYRVVGSGGTAPKYPDKTTSTHVRIDGQIFDVLCQGALKPNTYVTVKLTGRPRKVQFLRGTRQFCVCDVPEDATAESSAADEGGAVKPETGSYKLQPEILIAVAQNGQGTPVTWVCRRASG
ncbi:MAG TPA: hypothetical protein VEW48_11230 [Thermoanaerobaculia bacterium]|nr:hypothetical protein [Thermoanaerobaculia bacterium]